MKNLNKYTGWTVAIVILLFYNNCGNKQIEKVAKPQTPKAITPIIHTKIDTFYKTKYIEKIKKIGYSENDVENMALLYDSLLIYNSKLEEDFAKADSTLQTIKYQKAIELSEFEQNYEDDNLRMVANGIVMGKVYHLHPTYTLKTAPKKTQYFGILEVGTNLQNINPKITLGLINKHKTIYAAGYDLQGNYYLGIGKKL